MDAIKSFLEIVTDYNYTTIKFNSRKYLTLEFTVNNFNVRITITPKLVVNTLFIRMTYQDWYRLETYNNQLREDLQQEFESLVSANKNDFIQFFKIKK